MLLLCCVVALMASVEGADPSHRVDSLPGQPAVRFEQYAGYVTVHAGNGRALFYWFVQADSKKASSLPISFWFNGGSLPRSNFRLQSSVASCMFTAPYLQNFINILNSITKD